MRLITELCVNILKHFQTSKLGVSTDLCVVNSRTSIKSKKRILRMGDKSIPSAVDFMLNTEKTEYRDPSTP